MRKFAILFLFTGAMLHAQISNPSVRYVSVAPSGSCAASPPIQIVISTGVTYSCNNGTWGAIGGSGSGTVTSGTTGQIGYYASNGTTISGESAPWLPLAGGTMTGPLVYPSGTWITSGTDGYLRIYFGEYTGTTIAGGSSASAVCFQRDTDNAYIGGFDASGNFGVGSNCNTPTNDPFYVTAAGAATAAKYTTSGHVTTQPNPSANLCGSATLSGTNWTGSGLGPYTHSSGTTALTSLGCTALVVGQSYLVTYSMTAGGGGTVTPSFGGLNGSTQSTSATFTQYGTATSTTAVAFTPTTAFTGTVTLVAVVAQGPKATSCGTPVIVQGSTDRAGKLTTAVSGCVLTFQNAYTNAPSCNFKPDTAVTGDASQAVTNTTLTVTATGMTAFDYECIGLNE